MINTLKDLLKSPFNVFIILSPLLITSVSFPYLEASPAFITLFLCNIAIIIYSIKQFFLKSTYNKAEGLFIILGSILIAIYVIYYLFTYGNLGLNLNDITSPIYVSGFLLLFISVISNVKHRLFVIITSMIALLYTIGNFVLITLNNQSILKYTYYLNIPMIDAGKLFNSSFAFVLILFVSSLLSFLIADEDLYITKNKFRDRFFKIFVTVLIIGQVYLLTYNIRQIIAYELYARAATYQENNFDRAVSMLKQSILVLSSDYNNFGLASLYSAKLNSIDLSSSPKASDLEGLLNDVKNYLSKAKKLNDNYAMNIAYVRAEEYELRWNKNKELYDNVIVDYMNLLTKFPSQSAMILIEMSRASSVYGDNASALGYLNQALITNPSDIKVLMALAEFHAINNNLDQAISYTLRAINISPYDYNINYTFAELNKQAGRYDKAVEYYLNAYNLDNSSRPGPLYEVSNIITQYTKEKKGLNYIEDEIKAKYGEDSPEYKKLLTITRSGQ